MRDEGWGMSKKRWAGCFRLSPFALCFRGNQPLFLEQRIDPAGLHQLQKVGRRPAARSLKNVGLACLVAHSINGLFYRNCINFAFPGLECPGVHDAFEEGEIAEVDFDAATVRNITRGTTLSGRRTPPNLLELVKAGGIYPLLEKEGLIAPKSEGESRKAKV